MTDAVSCAWCSGTFTPRTTGGHAQRFCRETCRRAFDAAGRRFVAAALADGTLTADALRNSATTARALALGLDSPAPRFPDENPAAAPAASPSEADELLEDICSTLLLEDEAQRWGALAELLGDELFERLDSWLEARLG
jgi:hypothetical protein